MKKTKIIIIFLSSIIFFKNLSFAQEHSEKEQKKPKKPLGEIVVKADRYQSLVSSVDSASSGKVGESELQARPILRTGELLETVPGLIVTQHSGSGKANQYFLRGLNLDHGTDLRTDIDGMPVNMPTHAHGQGYTDLNFIIPELVDHLDFKKGVYYADSGDFSSAGAVDLNLKNTLENGQASISVGKDLYLRSFLANSSKVTEDSSILYAFDASHYDGPWTLEENIKKFNGFMRFFKGNKNDNFSLTAMAYHGTWNSTDQIPERAVDSGLISRLGNLDSTNGGRSGRYSLSFNLKNRGEEEDHEFNLYYIYYDLNLYSNFTYFLDDPVNGDQFEQVDKRHIIGGSTSNKYYGKLFDFDNTVDLGLQLRSDFIPTVALNKTKERVRVTTVREDDIQETTLGVYAKNETKWNPQVRTNVGLRADGYYFDVNSNNNNNSGNDIDGILSPKGNIIFGPWDDTELYVSAGTGFHSNDARGVTITEDPITGEAAEQVDPLVRTKGLEVGVRTETVENLKSTVSLWALDVDSELLFVGDAGATEASRPSRRYGIEFANVYKLNDYLALDLDYSLSHANFKDNSEEGDHIPGSINSVLATGLTLGKQDDLYSSIRLRYFGKRPLIEDNSIESDTTTLVNAQVGYVYKNLLFTLDILNLFNSKDHDIDYFYESQLRGEDQPIEDIHFHPVEPITLRSTVSIKF